MDAVNKPSIVGRDRVLVEKVAKSLFKSLPRPHESTLLRETPRGSYFEVHVIGSDSDRTGRVIRVTIELDRVDESLIEAR